MSLASNSNCFSTHIREAINKNIDRKSLYSKMTGGKSKFLSNLLITSEKATFVLAKVYDRRAREFQRSGIPILCLDYVDMDLTPFKRINPCGYENLQVTQCKELGIQSSLSQLADELVGTLQVALAE